MSGIKDRNKLKLLREKEKQQQQQQKTGTKITRCQATSENTNKLKLVTKQGQRPLNTGPALPIKKTREDTNRRCPLTLTKGPTRLEWCTAGHKEDKQRSVCRETLKWLYYLYCSMGRVNQGRDSNVQPPFSLAPSLNSNRWCGTEVARRQATRYLCSLRLLMLLVLRISCELCCH